VRSGRGEAEILDIEEGTLAGITLNNRLEKGNIAFKIENNIEPSGIGNLVNRTRGIFSVYNRLSERVSNTTSLTNTHNKSVGDLSGTRKWELRQLRWRVNIKFSKSWAFDSVYRYSWQKYSTQENAAQSNAILFTLGYAGF
jgi:hypothetical protein